MTDSVASGGNPFVRNSCKGVTAIGPRVCGTGANQGEMDLIL